MINDKKLYFSEDQAETTVAAHDSTNIIDLGTNKNAFGTTKENNYGINAKEANNLNILLPVAFTSSGSATLAIELQDSADGITYAATEISIAAVAVASLTIGKYWVFKLPNSMKRYLKVVYTIGVAAMTAGTVTTWIGDNYESRNSVSLTS